MEEGNVGKDLAIKEKIESIVSKIRSGENIEQEELIIAVKGVGIPLTIEKEEKDEKTVLNKINILGVHILTLEEEELSFTDGWEEELRAKTEGIIDAEDLIKQLKEMELSLTKQKEDQQREENQRDEKGLSGDMEEKKEEEPEREEAEKKDGEEQKTTSSKFPKKDSSWIEIKSDREADEMRTFMGIVKREYPDLVKGDNRLFIAPNPKDPNDYNLYAMDKSGKTVVSEIPLEHTEGKNQMSENVITYERDGSSAKTQMPIQMLKIGKSHNNAMIMIYNGTRTNTQVHIGVRTQGDNYQSHSISSSMSQNNFMDATEDVKYATSSSFAEREEGDFERAYYETLASLEKQGVPDEINPAKDNNEISVTEVEKFDDFRAAFAKTLVEEYGISEECAAHVAVNVLEKGQSFDKAIEQGILEEEKEKESKGTIPPGAAERFAAEKYRTILEGKSNEKQEEKTPDENPRRRAH